MSVAETLIQKSERLISLVKQQKYDSVLTEINDWKLEDRVERRLFGHLQGKIDLMKGDYSKAIQIFQQTIENEGPHILIMADLVACYYMNKQYTSWKLSSEELDLQIRQFGHLIHPTNRNRVEIILAKCFELQGNIFEAYEKYLNLYKKSDVQFRIKGLTNLVRLEALFPLSTDFSKHYLDLKQYSFNNEQADYDPDVVHSLLLAEAEHIDIELAVKTFSKMPQTQICFFALGYFELLDIWLRKNSEALNEMSHRIGVINPETVSDEKLLLLAQNGNIEDWYLWTHTMPISQYFRLLVFILKRLTIKDKEICISQVALQLKGLSLESQKVWRRMFEKDGLSLAAAIQNIYFDSSISVLNVNGVNISFGKQKLLYKLIQAVLEDKQISFEKLSHMLWNADYNPTYSSRIRQLVNRMNEITNKEALIDILQIKNDKVMLNRSNE